MNNTIGNTIKKLRLEKNISQQKLCENFMNRTILSKIENNKMSPSISQLEYISKKLDIPISYFFNNIDINHYVDKTFFEPLNTVQTMYKNENYYNIIKMLELGDIRLNKKDFKLCYFIGMSYFTLKIYKDASKFLKKYINNYNKSNKEVQNSNVMDYAIASNTLFKIMVKKDCPKGMAYLLQAIKQLNLYQRDNSLINFIIHSNLAYAYNKTSNYKKTIELLEFFLNTNKELAYINVIPDIHLSLNIAYYNTQQYDKSIEHIKKSIFFYSYIGNDIKALSCYLNLINALRYSKNFNKAFEILNICKNNIKNNIKLLNNFLIEEAILFFNIKEFKDTLIILDSLKLTTLDKTSKNNYFFLKGYIDFNNKNYRQSIINFKNCEQHFIEKKYHYDLEILYESLYTITKEKQYDDKINKIKNVLGRRNIF